VAQIRHSSLVGHQRLQTSEKQSSDRLLDVDKLLKEVDASKMKIQELQNFIDFKSREQSQLSEYYEGSKGEIERLNAEIEQWRSKY